MFFLRGPFMRITTLAAVGICIGILNIQMAGAQSGGKQIIGRDPASTMPFSPAVVAGDFIYLSGSLSREGNFTEQAHAVFERLGQVLEQAGAGFDRVAAVTVYLKDTSDFQAMNEVFREYWPTEPPTRSTIQADFVTPDALLEVSMVAIKPGAERTIIKPDDWAENVNPYSYAIKSGDTLFLAHLVGRNYRDNSNVEGGIQAETEAIFEAARQLLAEAGMSLANVVSSRVFLGDFDMFADMNATYREQWPDFPPARATVLAHGPGSSPLGITLVAVKGERERIVRPNPDGTPGRVSPILSHAVRVGNRLYLSGMLGVNDETRTDTQAQTREALATIGRTLDAAGFGFEHLVDGIVYLTDMSEWGEMNVAYVDAIGKDFPARAAVGTGLVSSDGRVEIMFTAVR